MKQNSCSVDKISDNDQFVSRTTDLFLNIIKESIKKRGKANIALSGGSTPVPIFKKIRTLSSRDINWEMVNIFWVDERCVPPDHPDSNFRDANKLLLNYLPDATYYRIKGEKDPEKAALGYESTLNTVLPKKNGIPGFDLIWLGMGTDGHTASLFPGTNAIQEKYKWVVSVWVEKLNKHRVTITLPVLNNAEKRMIVIKGTEKRKLLNEIRDLREKKYPIQYIYPSSSEDYWIIGE